MRDSPSQTAEWVCLFRAIETQRPPDDRVLDDPWATTFLGAGLRAALRGVRAMPRVRALTEPMYPGLVAYVACRHRYLDDLLLKALTDPATEQVVVLGAGYDTRAWRFAEAIAGRPVFEVDHPATAARKQRLLARAAPPLPEVDRRVVTMDFARQALDEELTRAGFRSGVKTAFLWEGVAMYLRKEDIQTTLNALSRLGGDGSVLGMDMWFAPTGMDPESVLHRLGSSALSWFGEPVLSSITPEAGPGLLAPCGWRITDDADADELERRYLGGGRKVLASLHVLSAVRSS